MGETLLRGICVFTELLADSEKSGRFGWFWYIKAVTGCISCLVPDRLQTSFNWGWISWLCFTLNRNSSWFSSWIFRINAPENRHLYLVVQGEYNLPKWHEKASYFSGLEETGMALLSYFLVLIVLCGGILVAWIPQLWLLILPLYTTKRLEHLKSLGEVSWFLSRGCRFVL